MPADPAVLAALVKALEADPESVPIRLHLAQLLIEGGGEASAMDHILNVLNREPTNVEAIALAVRAADALGDSSRAAAYRKLLASLQQPQSGPEPPLARRSPAPMPPPPPPHAQPLSPASDPTDPEAVPVGAEPDNRGWWEVEVSGVTLADVGGMEDVKRRLHVALIGPIRNPELREAYRKSLRGGLMLYGPPGCGKTFIARATAGELGAKFLAVGLAEVLDMWLGQSERHVQEIFNVARRNAPCVVFLDELDAIGQKRSNLRSSPSQRGVVNQLLSEMDGFAGGNEGVFVLGATNHPWDVDSALLRPGRFDRVALVLPPDRPAREAIIAHSIRERPVENIDVAWLAQHTEQFSGADLVHLCETATEQAMEESLMTGRVRNIGMNDFRAALKEVKPSTRAWFETARNYALFANEGGAYDDLLAYMRQNRMV
ncbi:MAG TPA: tetratricopeptide repeat protein [Candidatus Dormibacteraeota bacterium]|nr:tetratricopeptide repeat protein [Candidatus Dormibacteraeota bacterium]